MIGSSKAPKSVIETVQRGEKRIKKLKQEREICSKFYRGEQFCFLNSDYAVVELSTKFDTKPRHRVRNTWNVVTPTVRKLVADSTRLAQGFQVEPTSPDPGVVNAAKLSEKVALWGLREWRLDEAMESMVTLALVVDEAFIWPYFNNQVGTPLGDGVSTGEICFGVYGGNEVLWEPGVPFHDSRWFAIQQAKPVDAIEKKYGAKIKSRAKADSYGQSIEGSRMCMVTDYFERPSEKYVRGRWLTFEEENLLREDIYPCSEDRPFMHKLSWIVDPKSDRDLGFVRFTLDPQRTINDCQSKIIEWKNLMLNPQIIVKNGRLKQRLTSEPGAVYDYHGSGDIVIREVPPIPPELTRMRDDSREFIGYLASQNEIPSQVESGKGIEALLSRDSSSNQRFQERVLRTYELVMRDCLYLVQKHYEEARIASVDGPFGFDPTEFRGADLKDQTNVRVTTGPKSRDEMKQEIMSLIDRQIVDPQVGLKALFDGTPEKLVEDYERDIQWAYHIIRTVREVAAGKEDVSNIPHARPFDNHKVIIKILESWMKTTEFAGYPQEIQELGEAVIQGFEDEAEMKDMKEAQAQQARAESLGMANAAKPQGPPQMPDMGQTVPA